MREIRDSEEIITGLHLNITSFFVVFGYWVADL